MKQGGPVITAPISRKRTAVGSSHIGIICGVLAAIFAFGGTLIIAMAVMSSHSTNNNDFVDVDASSQGQGQGKEGGALRNSNSIAATEKRNLVLATNTNNNNINTNINTNINNAQPQPPQGLIIHTPLGDIRIHFTPELAGDSSIKYIAHVVATASATQNNGMGYKTAETMNGRRITEGFMCQKCKFYRAEKKLLLQGIIADKSVPPNTDLGRCPEADPYKKLKPPKSKCPAHDPNCGCHGPIMTRGMVGWAGGGGGPDFFINTFAKPVDWWENQHTVWGEIRDEKSLRLVESTYDLPAHMSGMRMLDQDIEFSLELF